MVNLNNILFFIFPSKDPLSETPSHLLTTLNTPIKHFAAPTFTEEKGMQEQARWEAAAGLSICHLLITELSQKARN